MPVDLSVKNVPDDIAEKLRSRAKKNHRSLQGELMAILEEAARPRRMSLEEADVYLKSLHFHTPDQATAWIREERDAR